MNRKYTLGLFLLLNFTNAQIKTTGLVPLGTGEMTVQIDLNDTTSKVTATLSGPAAKWFSIGLNIDCMCVADCLLYKDNTFYDAQLQGGHNAPIIDIENNWTLMNDVVNNSTRTIIITRDYASSDPSDYNFSSNINSMNIIWAYACDDPAILFSHCDYFGVQNLTFVELNSYSFDNELSNFGLFPNPASKMINLITRSSIEIEKISIFNSIGQLITTKTIDNRISNYALDIANLTSGLYFIEISNSRSKSIKKFLKL
ncbi:T9SS type A sorting domain-containing protein [Flavobacterium sp.]|uniref:T9SS type A sorting domain-containing protein n=1 Tax=Flavobacterium sp. TaxID=239 RepID=UPI0038D1BE4E